MFSGPKQVDGQHCWWKKSCTSWRAVYSIIYDRFHTSQVIGRSPEPTISLQSMCCSWTFVYLCHLTAKLGQNCHWCHTTCWGDLFLLRCLRDGLNPFHFVVGCYTCWFPQHSTKCTNKHEKGTYVWRSNASFLPNIWVILGAFMTNSTIHEWSVHS